MYLSLMMHEAGVYIHIPFCVSKCNYCDFLSFAGSESLYEPYVNSLLSELRATRIASISSVFIGGGTPTVLPLKYLKSILNCVSELPLSPNCEITIEANPGTVNHDYLRLFKSYGVNRLSFGLQSTCNSLLSFLGRTHTFEQFKKSYFLARKVGFSNINVDLIFGIPQQDLSDFNDTLSIILELAPQHISFYSLTPCEGTPLWRDLSLGVVSLPGEELDRSMYHLASKLFVESGYVHYEISNAAKPGFECIHNLDCWQHKPYIGFGMGAHSFDGQRRWSNPSSFSDYFNFVKPVVEVLSPEELMSEAMILGLRLLDGVDDLAFESSYGVRPTIKFCHQIEELLADNLIEFSGTRLKLTAKGLDLANQVFIRFLQGDVI